MRGMRRVVIGGALVWGALAASPGFIWLSAQAGDVMAVMQVESTGEPTMEMDFYLGENQMRMDMSDEMSLISIGGDAPSLYMVQHPEKSYIEFGPQQLQMMQQMMQSMPSIADQADAAFDPQEMQFQQTGATAQIGSWSAFEVEMTNSDGSVGSLWLTADTEIGLFEVMLGVADAASVMSSPMGGGMSLNFLQFQTIAQAQGLPDGQVVRIVSGDTDDTTTITLTDVQSGPLPSGTFEPPDGYTQMQMPSIPGFPG